MFALRTALPTVVAIATCLTSLTRADAKALTETQKIEALIKHVAELKDAVFVRNGKEYDGRTAVRFMKGKWGANEDEISTAKDFIEKAASFSTTSGQFYLIRFKDGTEQKCGEYLLAELKRLETETQKIEALIKHVAELKDAVFVRNGKEYDGKTAAKFIKGKWKANYDRIKTAEGFIEKAASFSTTSGQPYLIRFKDGTEQKSADYLRAVLKSLPMEGSEAEKKSLAKSSRRSQEPIAPLGQGGRGLL